jgi:predicted hydrocarbon binding protein
VITSGVGVGTTVAQRRSMTALTVARIHDKNHSMHNVYYPERFFEPGVEGAVMTAFGQRTMFVTEDFIVGFQLALEEEVGDAAGHIMYKCGLEWGKVDITNFEERMAVQFGMPITKMHLKFVLEQWWWPLQVMGWGAWQFDLSHREEGLIFVDLYESAVARSIGNIGRVVCHFYAGMFASVFSHLAAHELSGIEIQCYSMGESFCKFLIGSSKRINAAQFWVSEGASAAEIIAKL